MASSSKDKSEAALRREGVKLEEDFTRLSNAKNAAEKLSGWAGRWCAHVPPWRPS
jgi:hypothetical protein